MRSVPMAAVGGVLTGLGAIAAATGLSFIALDESKHDDSFDGTGTAFGGILMGVSAVPLAIGIPLLVVGTSRKEAPSAATTLTLSPAFIGVTTTS